MRRAPAATLAALTVPPGRAENLPRRLRRVPRLLWAITALGLLLRLPNLTQSLWYDELWSTRIQLGSIPALLRSVAYDTHPPLYSALMFAWIRLFGDSELSVRSLPLVLGTLSIPLTYALALRFTSAPVGLLTALLLALSPVHIWYSQEARLYAPLLFLLLATILAFYELREHPASRAWLLTYAVLLASIVLMHLYLVAILAVFSLLCVLYPHRLRNRLLMLHAGIFMLLPLFLLWRSSAGRILTGEGFLRPFTPAELWMLFFNWFLTGNAIWTINPYAGIRPIFDQPLLVTVQVVCALAFMRGLILLSRENAGRVDLFAYLWAIPVALLAFTLVGFANIYVERSVLVLLPFFQVAIARGASLSRSTAIFARPTVAAAAGLILIVGLHLAALSAYYQKGDEWTVYKPKSDWRAAARYFRGELAAGPGPVVVFAMTPSTELVYYDHRFVEATPSATATQRSVAQGRPQILYVGSGMEPCTIAQASRLGRFYLVHNRYWEGSFEEILQSVGHDPHCQVEQITAFTGLDVYRFRVVAVG